MKAHGSVGIQEEPALHRGSDSTRLLIGRRWLFPEIAAASGDDQRALSVDTQGSRPRIADSDAGRVRAGPHQELGLEIAALAAIDHVDTGIQGAIENSAIQRHIQDTWLVRNCAQEVDPARQGLRTLRRSLGIAAIEAD